MLFLIALTIALAIAFLLDKPLKKCPAAFYITAAVLTVAVIAVTQSDITISSRFVRDYIIGIFSRGALGAALWAVVMWAGALPSGSAPIKKLMPVRGELSITAAIITMSHVVTYGIQYVSNLIKGRTGSDFIATSIVSLAMVLIMIPLTVMSFKAVRKKMNAKMWKKIQRMAYVFYGLIYVHIMVIFVPRAQQGREGAFLSVLVYSAVFIGYASMRLRKFYLSRNKNAKKLVPNIVCACAIAISLSLAGFFSREQVSAVKETVSVSENSPAVFTFEPEKTSAVSTTAPATSVAAVTANTETKTVSETSSVTSKTELSTEASTETETTASTVEAADSEDENDETQTEPATEKQTEAATEPAVTYKYKNGEYTASAEGYSGKVYVKISIENDVITSISAWSDDDDPEYFGDAMNKVIPQIAANVSADGVDACSGATYSSKGIIEAAKKALEQATN